MLPCNFHHYLIFIWKKLSDNGVQKANLLSAHEKEKFESL